MIGYTNALAGEKEKAQQIINQLETQSRGTCKHAIKLARIYAVLGEKEKVFDYLERAYEEHDVDNICLISDPRWRTISHEPRFKEFISKIGLPAG